MDRVVFNWQKTESSNWGQQLRMGGCDQFGSARFGAWTPWQMSFNYDKCKVMHFGKKNREQTFTMSLGQGEQPHVIEKSLVERDLGLMVSSDLKWATQVEKATKAAKTIIAQIRKSFSYFDADLVRLLLHVSLVRPHLEFAIPVWNPYMKKDIEKLENIQHRATSRDE
jgi:hypothetical protein